MHEWNVETPTERGRGVVTHGMVLAVGMSEEKDCRRWPPLRFITRWKFTKTQMRPNQKGQNGGGVKLSGGDREVTAGK